MGGLKVKYTPAWQIVPNQSIIICSGELDKLKKDNAELLEALRPMTMGTSWLTGEDVERAKKAIAKAEGRA